MYDLLSMTTDVLKTDMYSRRLQIINWLIYSTDVLT